MKGSSPAIPSGSGRVRDRRRRGFTLLEMLMAIVIGALLVLGLVEVVGVTLGAYETTAEKEALTRDARLAMDQMVRMTRRSRLLLLPFHDRASTGWPENVREQTVPASPPVGGSAFATAVLALTLPLDFDLDGDGTPDADDDGDGLIDEDLSNDSDYGGTPGIHLIDDDGDGFVDENAPFWWNDDEYQSAYSEDPIDGVDNDGDGTIDEDPSDDLNADGCPGRCGVDDDGDGSIDEGSPLDDDEDGAIDEDHYDPLVFHLVGDALVQRTPVPWDEDGGGFVSGRDFLTHVLAEHVTLFRVVRRPAAPGEPQLVDLSLELTGPESGAVIRLDTVVRLGGSL